LHCYYWEVYLYYSNTTNEVLVNYYNEIIEYNKLASEKQAVGENVYCTFVSSNSKTNTTVGYCYDTMQEADEKLLEFRPDLEQQVSSSPTWTGSATGMSWGTRNMTFYYNSFYTTNIPSLTNICWSNDNVGITIYSVWVNGPACARLRQFANRAGNYANVCASSAYLQFGMGSFQWLG